MCLIAIPFISRLDSPINYWVTFSVLLVFGMFSGTVQGTAYTMAAGMGGKYMGMLFLGQGLIAVLMNIGRAITLVAYPVLETMSVEKKEHNSWMAMFIFYMIGACICIACVFLQIFFAKKPLAIYYLDWTKNNKLDADDLLNFDEKTDYNMIKS